jgi:Uma2 family endonuclease
MSAAVAQAEPKKKTPARQPKQISLKEFLRDYSDKEDGFKYELNNGLIEKTSKMNQFQSKLFFILNRLFFNTIAFKNGGGLISESDMRTVGSQLRRPDIAYYSGEQIKLMTPSSNQVAPWLAEVISPTDNADKINEKLKEYFDAGVQVVWHIYPASAQVYVYTALDEVTICLGNKICSGAPALPDLEISAAKLFA